MGLIIKFHIFDRVQWLRERKRSESAQGTELDMVPLSGRSSRSSRSVSTPLTSHHSAVRTVSRESPVASGNAKEPIRKSLVAPMPSLPCQLSPPRPLSCVLRESETRPRLTIEREQILHRQLASFHMQKCEALIGTRTSE